MTGEWFYETKQLRHRERIHGTDIVRASMKQAQKPLTLRESAGKKLLPPKSKNLVSTNRRLKKDDTLAVAPKHPVHFY